MTLDWIPEVNKKGGPDMVSISGFAQSTLREKRNDPDSGLIKGVHWNKKGRFIFYNIPKMNEWFATLE